MGIKDLNSFLRKRNINCFVDKYRLENLKGYRVGIDANNFIFMYGAGVQKDAVYRSTNIVDDGLDREQMLHKLYIRVLNFLILFMNNGITPLLVFDGTAEKEKTAEREKRRDERIKRQNRVNEIREEMEKTPVWLRTVKGLGDVPKELWDQALKYDQLEKELKKIMSTQVSVQYEEFDAIKDLLNSLGIPCIIADNEGEMMCAELGVTGQTGATFSTDSDCLALGIPFVFGSISGFKKGKGGLIEGTVLGPILSELNLSMSEFRDFCILLGTDFNERMPTYGPVKSYKLIEECRTIESIAELKKLDITPLNHVRTRHLLTPRTDRDWSEYQLDMDFEKFNRTGLMVLEQFHLMDSYSELKDAISYLKSVRFGS